MTPSLSFSSLVGYFVILMMVLRSGSLYANGCYTSIISFGDSLADTGSQKELSHITDQLYPCLLSPYGETFFDKPTGRCSNGRLIIDFLGIYIPLFPICVKTLLINLHDDFVELKNVYVHDMRVRV